MIKITTFFMVLLPVFAFAQKDTVLSGMYSWAAPSQQVQKNIFSTPLFEGRVHDMEWMQMNANTIKTSKKIKQQVPVNEEHLLIIKSGSITLTVKDGTTTIGAGSTALLMPGENYILQNTGNRPCEYYEMKYRSKKPVNVARANNAGGTQLSSWDAIAFLPNDNGGGRRNFFNRPTAMAGKLEIHVTTLKEGIKSHEPHTHQAEEIVLVINNKTEMQIGDHFYKGAEGSIYYLGSNVSHAIKNDGIGTCTYFAIQFE